MLKNRHFISYFSTTLIYILMISLFIYTQKHSLVSSKKSEEKSIQLCMSSFQPEVVSTVDQVEQEQIEEVVQKEPELEDKPEPEEEPVEEPEVLKEPIEEKKPEVKEEVIPEPIMPKVTPKPVVKKVQKKPVVKKKPKKKTVKKKTAKKKQVRQKASARKMKSSPAQKNQFLAAIREKINKHKSYPRIAKKRGMQGTVTVKFTILSSGKVGNISVSGPKVFHSSARNAVKSAFPISTKNVPISLPKSINIKLRYQIR